MPKAIIIADLRYKKRGQVKSLRNILKYLQYRDGSVRREAYLGADIDAELRYPEGLSDYVKPTMVLGVRKDKHKAIGLEH